QKLSELEPLKSVVPELQETVQTIKQQLEAERQQRAQAELKARKVTMLASEGLPADLADIIVGDTDEQLLEAITKLKRAMPKPSAPNQGFVGLGGSVDSGASKAQQILQRIQGRSDANSAMSALFARPPAHNNE
ncbi:MAG: DUF4355 domain-containing protein, partial [Chloroflexi bacterium]